MALLGCVFCAAFSLFPCAILVTVTPYKLSSLSYHTTQYKHSHTNGPIVIIFSIYIYFIQTWQYQLLISRGGGGIHFIFDKEKVKTQKVHRRITRHKSNSVSKHRENLCKSWGMQRHILFFPSHIASKNRTIHKSLRSKKEEGKASKKLSSMDEHRGFLRRKQPSIPTWKWK